MGLGQELYRASLEDINIYVENLEYFKQLERKYKYSELGMVLSETVRLAKDELKRELKIHEHEFEEKVNVNLIIDRLKGIGMRIKDVKTLIEYIDKTNYEIVGSEQVFINSLRRSTFDTITKKQAKWLNDIYAKATGGGEYAS